MLILKSTFLTGTIRHQEHFGITVVTVAELEYEQVVHMRGALEQEQQNIFTVQLSVSYAEAPK